MTKDLTKLTPEEFTTFLKDHQIQRCYFVWDEPSQCVRASHPELQPIADFLQNDPRDYSRHEGVFLEVAPHVGVLQGAFVHDTHRGQAQGGTRFWGYETIEDFLRDGLRLSKGMTQKNALAGLWWGGGKGVIARNPGMDAEDPRIRKSVFNDYGEFVTSLGGVYVTAEDVGTTPTDIANIFEKTRFTTCIPSTVGGSGNPSGATAAGVVRGMEAALNFMDGGTLEGRTIVVQGLGHVAEVLIGMLLERKVGKVIGSDITEEKVEAARARFGGERFEARLVEADDPSILFEECDILAPCATGGVINSETIPRLQARVLCGAANNQLEDVERDDRALQERGIVYVPDFLVNRMGIVNCSNEQYGTMTDDPLVTRHLGSQWEHSVFKTTQQVLQRSKESGNPPAHVAMELADELAKRVHPIFGHRGAQIIDSLVKGDWAESKS